MEATRKAFKILMYKAIALALAVFLAFMFISSAIEYLFNARKQYVFKNNTVNMQIRNIPAHIIAKFRPMIEAECKKQGLDLQYVNVLLAQGMQESNYAVVDIFQASESKYGGRVGMITSEQESIEQVVKRWIEIKGQIKNMGLVETIPLILQSYNFGSGYLTYVKNHGGATTPELANSFSISEARKDYFQELFPGAKTYGDPFYVEHVMRYLGGGVPLLPGLANENIKKALDIAFRYKNVPYNMERMDMGGIDCSGLVKVTLNEMGIECPRLADDQYYYFKAKGFEVHTSLAEAKPGDLIFFTHTYDVINPEGISHVGFYLGNNQMFDSSGDFVDFHTIDDSYWTHHFFKSITIFK